MTNKKQMVPEIYGIPNGRLYVSFIQRLGTHYKNQPQRGLVLRSLLSRQVHKGKLTHTNRKIILNYYKGLLRFGD